jgi:hypothetical protein
MSLYKDGRETDLRDIQQQMSRTSDPSEKQRLNAAALKIANEPSHVRQMREQLIKYKRDGRDQEVRDINETVMRDKTGRWT